MNHKSLILLFVLIVSIVAAQHQSARAGVLDPDAMRAALHTATPQENGFIDRVVAMVDKGQLPLDLVQSTFLWAKKKPHRKFFYFQQAMILRAADIGITIK
jgi:hypothetical protein